jgi:prevent-host-death family protein
MSLSSGCVDRKTRPDQTRAMKVLNIQQAKTHLSRLVEQALAGEEIVIAKAGRPCVQLTPYAPERTVRSPGGWEGKIWIAPDFDAEDPRVVALFEGVPVEERQRPQNGKSGMRSGRTRRAPVRSKKKA